MTIKSKLLLIMILGGVLLIGGCGVNKEGITEGGDTKETTSKSYVFTANESGSITKVNVIDKKVEDTIKTRGSIHNVQISPNNKILGATMTIEEEKKGHKENEEKSSAHDDKNNMNMNGFALFYDANTNKLIKEVEVGEHPAHIVFTQNGKYALVTNNGSNNVSVIDLSEFKVVNNIPTGKGPHGFRISNDDKYAYIANMGEDTISVLNLSSFAEDKKIRVGKTPVTSGIDSSGKTLLTTLHSENRLVIIDLDSEKQTTLKTGIGPAQVYIQPDGKYAYVANQGSKDKPSNTITKIDLKSNSVIATIETGLGAHGLVTSQDGKFLYVTNMFEDTISIIDNEQNKVTATINVGEMPNGITYVNN